MDGAAMPTRPQKRSTSCPESKKKKSSRLFPVKSPVSMYRVNCFGEVTGD
jgi:hypothetical protein